MRACACFPTSRSSITPWVTSLCGSPARVGASRHIEPEALARIAGRSGSVARTKRIYGSFRRLDRGLAGAPQCLAYLRVREVRAGDQPRPRIGLFWGAAGGRHCRPDLAGLSRFSVAPTLAKVLRTTSRRRMTRPCSQPTRYEERKPRPGIDTLNPWE